MQIQSHPQTDHNSRQADFMQNDPVFQVNHCDNAQVYQQPNSRPDPQARGWKKKKNGGQYWPPNLYDQVPESSSSAA
jgi:hypothetical protein